MPRLVLQDVANYVRTSKASKLLLAVLRKARKIFNFHEERDNRMSRFVAVLNAYQRGEEVPDIAKRYGCTRRTVYDYIEKAGIPRRSFKPEEVRKAVLKDYQERKIPLAKIAELHDVSLRYIQTEARKAGLRRNKGYGSK